MRTAISVLVTALLLASCAAGAGPSATPTPTPTPTPSESTHTLPVKTIAPPKVSPTLHIDRPPNGQMRITGVFGFDSIEGGCAYVQTDAKTRYEVLYPDGWTLDGNQLRNAQGQVVAQAGDTLTLLGSRADDMASTCQIGPIFRATEVTPIDR